jgi:hypothetical protein
MHKNEKVVQGIISLCTFPVVFAFVFFVCPLLVFSQDKCPVSFGKVSAPDFNLPKSSVVDDNASAVIIADVGSTDFVGNKNGWVSYVFKRHVRIKIINKNAFAAATVRIPLFINEDAKENADDIIAASYNNENGNVFETKLDKKDIFTDKINKHYLEKKFTVPGMKEGSIIEYSYTITSDFYFNIPTWEFQSLKYPCLWSEYEINIPGLLSYVFLRQGIHPFFIDKASEGHGNYTIREKSDEGTGGLVNNEHTFSINSLTNKHRWVMKDISPMLADAYIYSPSNYIDKIEFQLYQIYNGESSKDVKNNWAKATSELLSENDFGKAIGENYFQEPKDFNKIGENEKSDLDKARAIYYFIQNNFTCTNEYNKYITTTLDDVIRKKSGNVGEINLLLIGMLTEKNIHADPVMLSTRGFGTNYSKYPILDRLNYVICRAVIDGNVFYLDATHPMLGFGKLSEDAYNGHARIICEKDSASIYFSPDSIKDPRATTVFIYNDEKSGGIMSGTYQSTHGYFESTDIRNEILKNGKAAFFKKVQLMNGVDFRIENEEIDSLKLIDQPVKVHYDFSFKNNGEDFIYFTPTLGAGFQENPFKASERKYPVEMRFPIDDLYVLSMEIPAGYLVDEIPKTTKVVYNDNEGFFEYIIQKDDNNVQLRYHLKLNKAIFQAEDYNTLRDFFAMVVKKQSEQIVFKKKK